MLQATAAPGATQDRSFLWSRLIHPCAICSRGQLCGDRKAYTVRALHPSTRSSSREVMGTARPDCSFQQRECDRCLIECAGSAGGSQLTAVQGVGYDAVRVLYRLDDPVTLSMRAGEPGGHGLRTERPPLQCGPHQDGRWAQAHGAAPQPQEDARSRTH